jgi:tetratricopeptide (TPR) repeat protein
MTLERVAGGADMSWPEVDAGSPDAYDLYRRGCSFLAAGHPGQASLFLERALRMTPEKNSVRETLARALFALGRHDRAAELFAEIVAAAPVNDYAHYGLGRSLLALGRRRESLGHLRLACAMNPGNVHYRAAVAAAGGETPGRGPTS